MKNINREIETVQLMIVLYCRKKHRRRNSLCDECTELSAYARKRLRNCPLGSDKPVCSNCSIHCYEPTMREKIKSVMRFAGPRMVYRHPIRAIEHLLRKRNK